MLDYTVWHSCQTALPSREDQLGQSHQQVENLLHILVKYDVKEMLPWMTDRTNYLDCAQSPLKFI